MKYNISFLGLLLFLNNFSINAQTTTFSKIISTSLDETVKDVYEDCESNFYYIGYNASPGYHYTKTNGFIMKTDKFGFVIDSATFSSLNKSIEFYNIFPDSEGNLDISGYSSTDFNWPHKKSNILLKKLDTVFNEIKTSSIKLPPEYGLQHIKTKQGFNNDFLFVSYVWYATNFLFNPIFCRVNSDYDSLTFKIDLTHGYIGEEIKQLDTNIYWFTSASGSIQLMDTLFKYLGSSGKIPHYLSSSYGIKWDTDTSFYLVGEWDDGPDDDIGFIRQYSPLDTNNNIFNTYGTVDTLDYPAEYGGLDFKNKDSIYIGGTINYRWSFNDWNNTFFILQTDSLLNIRWEKFYGGDAYYVMTRIKATNDGGCIAIGDRYDYLNTDEQERDIYILKLNNEGLITSTNENQSSLMHEAIVFPNPGTDKFNVRIASQYPESTVELYNINGQLVIKQEIEGKLAEIETTFLKTGTYIYKIYNKQGLYENGKWIKN